MNQYQNNEPKNEGLQLLIPSELEKKLIIQNNGLVLVERKIIIPNEDVQKELLKDCNEQYMMKRLQQQKILYH